MKETFLFLLTVFVAITMEENVPFEKCAEQTGQMCQNKFERLLKIGSITPPIICSALKEMVVCFRGVCSGSSYSFIDNIRKKHNLNCLIERDDNYVPLVTTGRPGFAGSTVSPGPAGPPGPPGPPGRPGPAGPRVTNGSGGINIDFYLIYIGLFTMYFI